MNKLIHSNNLPIKISIHQFYYSLVAGLFWAFCFLTSCNPSTDNSTPSTTGDTLASKSTFTYQDSIQIVQLVKDMYRWKFSEKEWDDFPLYCNNPHHFYEQLDSALFNKRYSAVMATGFFSDEFGKNYRTVAKHLDSLLKFRKLVWNTDEVAPVGHAAIIWCDCQDYPDDFWNHLKLAEWHFDNGLVNCKAFIFPESTVGYQLKVKQENGKWKIAYMEGFDASIFFPTEANLPTH